MAGKRSMITLLVPNFEGGAMSRIAIVTDSTSDLPKGLAEKLKVHIVALTVHMGGNDYIDGIDLTKEEMLAYLCSDAQLPTTSQPTPADFVKIYENLAHEGYDAIISLHISEELSGTVNGARIAAEKVQDLIDVRVYDSRSATAGLGIQILQLVDYLEHDANLERACRFIEDVIDHTKVYFLLGSLDNLAKGGRIGKASYMVGTLLQVKPVLVLEDGVIAVYDKLRTRRSARAISYLVDLLNQKTDEMGGSDKVVWLTGFNNEELGLELIKQLEASGWKSNLPEFRMGTVVSTHIGLDAVGIILSGTKGEYPYGSKN